MFTVQRLIRRVFPGSSVWGGLALLGALGGVLWMGVPSCTPEPRPPPPACTNDAPPDLAGGSCGTLGRVDRCQGTDHLQCCQCVSYPGGVLRWECGQGVGDSCQTFEYLSECNGGVPAGDCSNTPALDCSDQGHGCCSCHATADGPRWSCDPGLCEGTPDDVAPEDAQTTPDDVSSVEPDATTQDVRRDAPQAE